MDGVCIYARGVFVEGGKLKKFWGRFCVWGGGRGEAMGLSFFSPGYVLLLVKSGGF